MRESRFMDTEILYAVKQAGVPFPNVPCKYGVSVQTVHPWRSNYTGPSANEPTRARQLENENRNSSRMAAEVSLHKQMLQDVLRKESAAARRDRE
jgi:putative transposase